MTWFRSWDEVDKQAGIQVEGLTIVADDASADRALCVLNRLDSPRVRGCVTWRTAAGLKSQGRGLAQDWLDGLEKGKSWK